MSLRKKEGKAQQKTCYRSMPRPHLFEPYLWVPLKSHAESFGSDLVQRMDILTKASSVSP